MQKIEWSCLDCVHFYRSLDFPYPVCGAFPEGIPFEIMSGERAHTAPYDGDGGIIFDRRQDQL